MIQPIIRTWNNNDLSKLVEIDAAVHTSPWNRDAFLMCMQQGYLGYVATTEHEKTAKRIIIGFIVISAYAEECHILNISVALAFQRQGIGNMLLNYALNEAQKKHHAKVAYLEVRRSNTRAIKLYRGLNFEQIGERKDYYKGPHQAEDALIFVKLLKPTTT